jgi:hypothetical protein
MCDTVIVISKEYALKSPVSLLETGHLDLTAYSLCVNKICSCIHHNNNPLITGEERVSKTLDINSIFIKMII